MSAVLKRQNQYESFGTLTHDLSVNGHLDWLETGREQVDDPE